MISFKGSMFGVMMFLLNTVSSHIYTQSVSSEMRIKVGVIASHVLHRVMTDLEMTSDPNRGLHAVQNSIYTRGYSRSHKNPSSHSETLPGAFSLWSLSK